MQIVAAGGVGAPVFNYQFRWDIIPGSLDFLLSGLQMTLFISATTLVLAMVGGLALALMDMSRFWPIRTIGLAFGEIVRNTPILVQLLWVYYVLPIVFGIGISSLAAILIGLSVYMAAFISEVYRAGIQAVPKGHREAAQVLGEVEQDEPHSREAVKYAQHMPMARAWWPQQGLEEQALHFAAFGLLLALNLVEGELQGAA